MTSTAGLFKPMRDHDCRWLATALTVSQLGDWLYGVSLAVFVYNQTGSAAWVAAAAIARLAPYVVLSPYGGVLADRFPRIRLMWICDLLRAAVMFALAAVVYGNGPVLLAVVLAAVSVCCGTPYVSATQASIPDLVNEDQLAATNTLLSVIENVAIVAGPVVAVGLLRVGTPGTAFIVNAATFLLSAAALSRIRGRSRPAAQPEAQHTWTRLAAGLRALRGSGAAAVSMAYTSIAYLLYGVDGVIFVVVSTRLLGSGSAGFGYLLAALGVGGLLIAPLVNRLAARPRLIAVLTGAMVVYSVPLAVLTLVHSLVPALLLIVVRGAAFVVIDVLAVTAVQRLVRAEVLARVFGIYASIMVASTVAGAAIVPPVVSGVGLNAALLGFGLVFPALAVLGYPLLRPLDDQARQRVSELTPRLRVLEALPIFAAAPRAALEQLAAAAQQERVGAGAVVVMQGTPAEAFYVVEEGTLAVTSTGEGGGPARDLASLGPGDYFGEIGLLAGIPRTATVTSRSESILWRISGAAFLSGLHDSPAAALSLRDRAVTRLARTHPTQVALLPDSPASTGGAR